MKKILSLSDLKNKLLSKDKAYLLLYKKGKEKSDCAFENLKEVAQELGNIELYNADVNETIDIHTVYNITSVPSLLEFENGILKNITKGCNDKEQYKTLFEGIVYSEKDTKKTLKRVTVYSTPSCSWCSRLKNHLKQHRIKFTDIDVSVNQKAADEMVRKSGQRGVPQTDINGEMIIGFNQPLINELLNIQG